MYILNVMYMLNIGVCLGKVRPAENAGKGIMLAGARRIYSTGLELAAIGPVGISRIYGK